MIKLRADLVGAGASSLTTFAAGVGAARLPDRFELDVLAI